MENYHVCENCSTKNALYALNCTECKSYLRERVVNIDLGSFVFRLIEEPFVSLRKVIFAEHKNYSLVFFILLLIKVFSISFIVRNILPFQKFDFQYFWIYFMNIIVYFLPIFLLLSFSVFKIHQFLGNKERLKDQFATFTFAATPAIMSIVVLLPVEFALFGTYWFTFNPSPFILKSGIAYLLFGIEGILLLWTLFLFFVQFHIRTKKILYSIIAALISFTLLFGLPIIVPVFSF